MFKKNILKLKAKYCYFSIIYYCHIKYKILNITQKRQGFLLRFIGAPISF